MNWFTKMMCVSLLVCIAVTQNANAVGADNAEAISARDSGAMEHLVKRCATLHLDHIREGGDPFEAGSARPLDFGHWSAHRLEDLTDYELRHGEAVAIGLALDCRYAAERGLLDEHIVARVCVLLERLGFQLWHPSLALRNGSGQRQVLKGLEEFREHLGGDLTLTLIQGIGRSCDVGDIDSPRIESAVEWLEYRNRTP